MPHIARLSRLLRGASVACLILVPLAWLWGVTEGWRDPAIITAHFAELPPGTTITPLQITLTAVIGAVALPPILILLLQMQRLFARYTSGEILTPACATHIRRIGQMLVALAALGVAIPTLQLLALTMGNGPGQKVLAIGLSSDTLGLFLAGGLLTVIGWVMGEAARVAEDNAGFI